MPLFISYCALCYYATFRMWAFIHICIYCELFIWAHTMPHIYYFYFTSENDQLGRLSPSEHTPVTLTSLRNRICYLQILSLIPKRRQVHNFSKLYINEILYSWPLVLYIRIVTLIHVIIWSSFILLTVSSSTEWTWHLSFVSFLYMCGLFAAWV